MLESGSEEVCKDTDQARPLQSAHQVLWEVFCCGRALCFPTGESSWWAAERERACCLSLLSLHCYVLTVLESVSHVWLFDLDPVHAQTSFRHLAILHFFSSCL